MALRINNKYHQTLSKYFAGKPFYIDRKNLKPNTRKLIELPFQQIHGQQFRKYKETLLNYHFLQAKVFGNLIFDLIEDYNLIKLIKSKTESNNLILDLKDYEVLEYIKRALKLSVLIIQKNTYELVSQLVGRLERIISPDIQNLLNIARVTQTRPSLIPVFGNLFSPVSSLSNIFYNDHAVFSIALIKSEEQLLSAGEDGVLHIRDIKTGLNIKKIKISSHGSILKIFPILNDEFILASSFGPIELKLIELRNSSTMYLLDGHKDVVNDIAVNLDSTFFITASSDTTLKVWETKYWKEIQALIGHKTGVLSVAISQDSYYACSGSYDGDIIIWRLTDGQILTTLSSKFGQVQSLAIHPYMHKLVAGYGDGTIIIWSLNSYEKLMILNDHMSRIMVLKISSDGNLLISGYDDGSIIIRDFHSGMIHNILRGHSDQVRDIALTADNKYTISASSDWSIKVWDNNKRNNQTIIGHKNNVFAIGISTDGNNVISGGTDGEIRFWDFTNATKHSSSHIHNQLISNIKISAITKNAISASYDGTVRMWDLSSYTIVRTFWLNIGEISAQSITKDNKYLFLGSTRGELAKLSYIDGAVLWVKKLGVTGINSIDVSQNGNYLASSSNFGPVIITDTKKGKKLQTILAPTQSSSLIMTIYHLRFSPDSYNIFGACDNSKIYCWDWRTKQIINIYSGHNGKITSVNFENCNKYMFSTAEDATLKVWDIHTKIIVASFTCDGPICSGGITLSGNKIVIGEQSGKIHFLEFINPIEETKLINS